jgi:signal transduction histidine kinase
MQNPFKKIQSFPTGRGMRIVLVCVAVIIGSITCISYISSSLRTELSSIFDKQARVEQGNLLETLIRNFRYEASAKMRIWSSQKQSVKPLHEKEFNSVNWESNLLGIGNAMAVGYGAQRIITLDYEGKLIHNYAILSRSPEFDIEDKYFKDLLKQSIEFGSFESGLVFYNSETPVNALIWPVENEEEDLTHFMVILLDFKVIGREFKKATELELFVNYSGKMVLGDQEELIMKSSNNKYLEKRILKTNELFPDIEQFEVFVCLDKTVLHENIVSIENNIIIIFLIFFSIFLFVALILFVHFDDQNMKSIEANRLASLGVMAGGIAHEINNPLTVIQAHAMFLKKKYQKGKLEDQDFYDGMDKIGQVVERISKIVISLRNLSRDDKDKPFENVKSNLVFDDIINLSKQKIENKKIHFKFENKIPEEYISCRQVEISRVLLNLLTNALDAVLETKKEYLEITFSLYKEGDNIHFSVRDNGCGIDKKNVQKIMNPFFTTKAVGHGTGIGLSLSKKIAEDHGGSLRLNLGTEDTEFILCIPQVHTA